MSEYPPEGSFAEWCEQPIRNEWRENLTELERERVIGALDVAPLLPMPYDAGYKISNVLIAKMSKLLDALTRLNERTEAQRMELIMNTKEQA